MTNTSELPPHLHPDTLCTLGGLIVDHPAWKEDDQGRTWCNYGVGFVARVYGFRGFVTGHPWPQSANHMHHTMIRSPEWVEVDRSEVVRYAMVGCLVVSSVTGDDHGHVCVAMPEPMQHSGSYGGLVPVYANVGRAKYQGIKHLGWCIPARENPKHFLYIGVKT